MIKKMMISEKLRKLLPYAGLPVLVVVCFIVCASRLDTLTVLQRGLLVVFGYIATVGDIKARKIPNPLTLAMLAAWVLVILPPLFYDIGRIADMLIDAGLGFALGGGLFLLIYFVSRKGLGGGDVKFMAVAGLYLGFRLVLSAMLFGSVLAALTGIVLIAFKKIGRKDTIPLAPFLFAGILTAVFLL